VPNKCIIDYGSPDGFWDRLGIELQNSGLHFARSFADAFAKGCRQGGKLVEQNRSMLPGKTDTLAEHMADPNLWGYAYAGHGSKGSLIYGFTPDGGRYGLSPGRYVHHRIANMLLFACESLHPSPVGSAFWDEKTTGGRLGGFSVWETNVSRYGHLFGYQDAFRAIDLSFIGGMEVRSGGLRKTHDRGPEQIPKAFKGFD
jgi:hypothetical protein